VGEKGKKEKKKHGNILCLSHRQRPAKRKGEGKTGKERIGEGKKWEGTPFSNYLAGPKDR